ncbi:TetR/AcrR family transcriptional regulator [Nocardia abscessus]|uniref:TetR/AcrR family transcriptional regulator n=1 Tax=Nocardia abscessus TaxID=120957 RepID=UPI0024567167|nr:TetR/AcrR family transcriptional regulator [Nocardia abscessus]
MAPSRKYPKGDIKREEVLEAAATMIAEQGWDAISIRGLAARVGLSATAVVHHVGSKDELLLELLRRRDRPRGRSFEGLGADESLGLMLAELSENRRVSGMRELYIRLSAEATAPDHVAREFFRARYRELEDIGSRIFAELQESGRLPDHVDPASIATLVVALIDGLQLQSFFRPEVDVVTQFQSFLRLILGAEADSLVDSGIDLGRTPPEPDET